MRDQVRDEPVTMLRVLRSDISWNVQSVSLVINHHYLIFSWASIKKTVADGSPCADSSPLQHFNRMNEDVVVAGVVVVYHVCVRRGLWTTTYD